MADTPTTVAGDLAPRFQAAAGAKPDATVHSAVAAEQALIGGLMLLPDEWNAVAGKIADADFTDTLCRQAFTAVEALNNAGQPSYPAAVATWLQDHSDPSAVRDADAIRLLAEHGATRTDEIAQAAEIVRRKAIQRQVADCLAALSSAAARPDADAMALMEQARSRFDQLEAGAHVLPPRITSRDCLNPPKLDFVLPGLLVGTVGLIVGPGAIGKSMLAYQIAADTAAGAPIAAGAATGQHAGQQLWAAPTTGPTAVCFGEDRHDEIATRGHVIYASMTPTQVERADGASGLYTRSTIGMDMRVICAKQGGWAPGPFLPTVRRIARGKRLLILDPLAFLHDTSENDNGAMTYLMRTLARVADDTGCAILVLHHVGKPGDAQRDEAYDARGASALTTAARVQYSLRKLTDKEAAAAQIDPDARGFWMRFAVTKANYIPPQQPSLLRRLAGGLLAFGGKQEAPKSRGKKPAATRKEADDEDW